MAVRAGLFSASSTPSVNLDRCGFMNYTELTASVPRRSVDMLFGALPFFGVHSNSWRPCVFLASVKRRCGLNPAVDGSRWVGNELSDFSPWNSGCATCPDFSQIKCLLLGFTSSDGLVQYSEIHGYLGHKEQGI